MNNTNRAEPRTDPTDGRTALKVEAGAAAELDTPPTLAVMEWQKFIAEPVYLEEVTLIAEGIDLTDVESIERAIAAKQAEIGALDVLESSPLTAVQDARIRQHERSKLAYQIRRLERAKVAVQLTAEGVDLAEPSAVRTALSELEVLAEAEDEKDAPLRDAYVVWCEQVELGAPCGDEPRVSSELSERLDHQVEFLEDHLEELVEARRTAAAESVAEMYEHIHGCRIGCCEEGLNAARAILDGVAADTPSDEYASARLLQKLSCLINYERDSARYYKEENARLRAELDALRAQAA